jgi:outer membrane protein OmpA-like peptidoglycan-associated protein
MLPRFHRFLRNADENAVTVYGNRLVFASDRANGFGLLKQKSAGTGRDFLNIYSSTQQENGAFSKPKVFSSALSELNKNVSNASFTADGRRVYFCRNSDVPSKSDAYNLQLFTAETQNGRSWTNVERLAFCNPDNNYLHPAISPDGNTLYYVAERADGLGGTDIYASVKSEKGKWSKGENLGWRINTVANEGFPFAAADGKLYFCSKGHAGLGGFDIFFSEHDLRTGEWTAPRNLGAPVNSPYDDISICVADSGRFGAFTSSRSERGDDIFTFTFADTVRLLEPIVFHNGSTKKEKLSTIAKKSKKKVAKNVDKQTVTTTNVDNSVGENSTAENLAEKSDKAPVVEQAMTSAMVQPVTLKTRKIQRDTTPKTYLTQLKKLIAEKKLRLNKTFVLENVRYADSMGVEITPDIAVALDDLADILLTQKIVVEIGAYSETVSSSDDKSLRERTQLRAQKAVEYLIERGVKEKYLTAKGYGRAKPLKDCREGDCTPQEDERNRRLELKIKEL